MPEEFNADGANAFDDFLARYLAGEQARQSRSIDLTRFLTTRTQAILQNAGRFALERGQTELDALHILRVLVQDDAVAQAIRRVGVDPMRIVAATESRLPAAGAPADVDGATVTPSASRALFHAYQVARSSGSTYIDPEHVFFALVLGQDAPAGQILAHAGVTAEALTQGMREAMPTGTPEAVGEDAGDRASTTPMLDKYATDLTALARDDRLDPVIGRVDEIEQTIEILSRRTKNNPVLVGEAGVGKTAIVEGLARAIVAEEVPQQLRDKRVLVLDLPAMLAGARYRGDFEERLTKTMDEIAAAEGEIIAFVDEVHTVVGAGAGGEGAMDAGNILKPRLARGDLHLVGATTLKEYRTIEKDPALERRFQPVRVGEPSVADAVLILQGLRPAYEEHHGVSYTDEALRAAVELSDRYVTERVLPDKAIDLIDQAGARLRLRLGAKVDVSSLMQRLADLEAEKNSAVVAERYEEASAVRDRIAQVQAEIDEAATRGPSTGSGTGSAVVDEPEIAAVISRATGIPVSRLTATERARLASLGEELHGRVIGQDTAVEAVAKAVRRNRTGMGDARRPIGSFLFLGPTGVGKTELAKALAASVFSDEDAVIRFDMSEFGERHTVSRLVGAPPGYVGYDEAGQLTERVRRNPYSVVLFDEIEKAHPDVFNLLLQVLDDGRLTDGQGRTVDFRNTLIVLTSNLGSEALAALPDGADVETARPAVMAAVRDAFRPEFLNRLDEILLFRRLSRADMEGIVAIQLRHLDRLLAERKIVLEVNDAAKAWLANAGYDPVYGARPLKRVIQRELQNPLAQKILEGSVPDGSTVHVGASPLGLMIGEAGPGTVPGAMAAQ